MRPLLMHPDHDVGAALLPPSEPISAAQDLELGVLLDAAAAGDQDIRGVMTAAFAQAWDNDVATILYRQAVLRDCLDNRDALRRFHAIACEPFGRDQGWNFSLYGRNTASMVTSGVRTLRSCLDVLARLRQACRAHAAGFRSPGFLRFFAMLERDLDDAYLAAARADLEDLAFRNGVLLSARVGEGGKAIGTMLRDPQPRDRSWLRRLLTPGGQRFTYQLHPRDDAGAQAFSELQGRGLGLISEALYTSAGHVLGFLRSLRAELGFYLGCVTLKARFDAIGEPVCLPEPRQEPARLRCANLRDACLALTMGRPVVGNDVDADGRPLVIVTGANRGGKSTFLRSVGLAQLMLQCGLFVTADAFSASVRSGLFTHYRRQEDRGMRSGKFDEELVRMSAIADRLRPGAMVLFNESFAATHEREGAEIARQIVTALLDNGVTVVFVSHMYEFARAFLDDDRALFLRAERSADGARSFRLSVAKPLATSFGIDLYGRIFGAADGAVQASSP